MTNRKLPGISPRKENLRSMLPRFLIVCEGKQTEPNYFSRFRYFYRVHVDPRGIGKRALTVVDEALRLRKLEGYTRKDDEVWCVFDHDDLPSEYFNRAVRLAEEKGLHVAYSNEAFELWFLLHFAYLDTGITRGEYCAKLNGLLGCEYLKNDPDIFDQLFDKMPDAIERAGKLLCQHGDTPPADANPSTTVHLLVEALRRYAIQP